MKKRPCGGAENHARAHTHTHTHTHTDIPLFTSREPKRVNFVCEIPKFSRRKYEIATKEVGNPIKQDEKKGMLREFKLGDLQFNYGCLPRTWENPNVLHADTGFLGDDDPIDVCEIGLRPITTGSIVSVKVLGVLAMIDDEETDWKLVCIDANDPWADSVDDIEDVDRVFPGLLYTVREWFRNYKVPDGKPQNQFALDEHFMNAAYAYDVIYETHEAWAALIEGDIAQEDNATSCRKSMVMGSDLMGEKKVCRTPNPLLS